MEYIFIVILLFLSAFFSGTEIAYTSLNKLKLKRENEEQTSRAQKLVNFIYNRYDYALSTILIGNNLVNIAATSLATVLAIHLAVASGGLFSDDQASSIVTIVMTILILIFGEITPKMICSRRCEAVTRFTAYPLLLLMILFFPAVAVTSAIVNLCSRLWRKEDEEDVTITEEELENILDTVEDEGVMDEERTDLLQSALDFSDQEAANVLTPRIDVVGFEIHDSQELILKTIQETQFSRFPVYERSMDHVVGILYVKSYLKALAEKGSADLKDYLLEPVYIPKSMKLHIILNEFRTHQTHMAVVADEYGGTMGIVTMEDVLEQLVGEIWDENDDIVNEWQKLSDTRYECSGDMNLSEFLDELDMDERDLDSNCTTVGGWAAEMIGAMPVEFDAFDFKNITIIVKQVENNRVSRLIILLHNFKNEEDD